MSGKFNNRILLLIFLVLVVILIISRFTGRNKAERTLVTDIAQIDTALVTSIQLYPVAENGRLIGFKKSGGSWDVTMDKIEAAADRQAVQSMLNELQNLETNQLVSRSVESWNDYDVNDSLGTRIVIREGNKTTLDLVVGRFQYQQPSQSSYNPYQRNQVSGKTYVRLYDEDEVYSVDGFLALSINRDFASWRDKTVTNFSSNSLTKVVFDYPADSGFVARKNEAGWMVAGILADSASMASWVNRVAHKTHREFANGFKQPSGEPDFQVSFEGDNMSPQQVSAWVEDQSHLVLNSSINPGTWFSSGRGDLFTDLFPGSEELISP
jgi:hypothetical protein